MRRECQPLQQRHAIRGDQRRVFVLVIGGFLGLTMKTGAIDAGISALVGGLGNRGALLIPILMGVFMLAARRMGWLRRAWPFTC